MVLNQFTTARLSVQDWRPMLGNAAARQTLEADLSEILTHRVLENLPPPLQLDVQTGGISSWVAMRAEESEVLLVNRKDDGGLAGLLILAPAPDATKISTIHIGYLLAEQLWGQGFASELLIGLVAAFENQKPARLIGGVDSGNPASARVLQKAGFVIDPELSKSSTDFFVLDID